MIEVLKSESSLTAVRVLLFRKSAEWSKDEGMSGAVVE